MKDELVLTGCSIIVTRPEHQAAAISQQLKQQGAFVTNFPLLAITEPQDQALCHERLARISQYDYLIFTSPNAVERGLEKLSQPIPQYVKVAAVGRKTAEVLRRNGVTVTIIPNNTFNSEALLACDDLQSVRGCSIAIIRGEGGRELLRDTLLKRGAKVEYIDVYRRICPANNLVLLDELQRQDGIDLIILTSVEMLQHLFRLGTGSTWLNGVTLLAGSERIRGKIKQTSHSGKVLLSPDPSDESILRCIMGWVIDNKI